MQDGAKPAGRGFFRTTLSVCSGTDEFQQIAKTPFSRTLLHFTAIALLASVAFMAMRAPSIMRTTSKYCGALHSYFGGVRFDSKGLFPLKDEDKPRKLKLGSTRIDYIPDAKTEYAIDDSGAANGIIWIPNSLYVWSKTGSEFQYYPLLSGFVRMQKQKGTTSKLENILRLARADSFDASIYQGKDSFDFTEARLSIFLLVALLHFAAMLFNIVFSIPLYALIILSISTIFGSQLLDGIKTLNFLSVILYSSFPAIIIGTIYSGLSLPLLDFKTVCFVGFSIYSFVVINSLQKKLNPKKQDEDYDDDIF